MKCSIRWHFIWVFTVCQTGPCIAVGDLSDCRSWGPEFDTGQVSYIVRDLEIISMAILLPSADSRRVIVSWKLKHEVLVNRLVKLAQDKLWLGELTVQT